MKRLASELSDDTLAHLLFDQLLPRILDHEGAFVLHAAAVEVGAGVVLIIGDSGRGKSTLSAALDRQGHDLLVDDGVTLEMRAEEVLVSALYPSLRLLPDSITALYGKDRESSPTAFYTPKRRVGQVATEKPALPCRALFVLAPPNAARDDILVSRIDPTEACVELLRESFALDPSDTTQAARRLQQASRVAELIPAFELAYPRDYALLPAVGRALIAAVGTER